MYCPVKSFPILTSSVTGFKLYQHLRSENGHLGVIEIMLDVDHAVYNNLVRAPLFLFHNHIIGFQLISATPFKETTLP